MLRLSRQTQGLRIKMTYLLITYLILVTALTTLDSRVSLWQRGLIKMSAASMFIAIPGYQFAHLSPFKTVVFIGLIASWVGDLCLVYPGTGKRFKLGIFSFLLAHFAYAGAFLMHPLIPMAAAGLFICLLAVSAAIFARLQKDMPQNLQNPVRIYIFALVAMTALAWSIADSSARIAYGTAATAFLISDISVALQRFGTHAKAHRLWGVPLYFGAQMGFALLITEQWI